MIKAERDITEALIKGELRDTLEALLKVAERTGERPDLREQMSRIQQPGAECDAYAHQAGVEAIAAGRAHDAVTFTQEQLKLVTRAAAAAPAGTVQLGSSRPRTAIEIELSNEVLKRFGDSN
jgi:hypothetical protein